MIEIPSEYHLYLAIFESGEAPQPKEAGFLQGTPGERHLLHKYLLKLSYVGTSMQGWQSQPSGNTVQDYLNKALRLFLRENVTIHGSSRTDAGVHAYEQIGTFLSHHPVDTGKLIDAINALTPPSITLWEVHPVPMDFHPISSPKGKVYRYQIWNCKQECPFLAPFAWTVPRELCVKKLRDAADALTGRHDFTSFCASDASSKTRIREVNQIVTRATGPLIQITISGNGFLKQMVRTMIGTMIADNFGQLGMSVPAVIAKKNRRQAGKTAPARGLTLLKILIEDGPESIDLANMDDFSKYRF